MESSNLTNKAQIWGADLFIAVAIFSISLAFFYFYALNSGKEAQETLQPLIYQGDILSQAILSEGNPKDWNISTVTHVGILSEGKINQTKLEYFFELAHADYQGLKRQFNTPYHFYFYLDQPITIYGTEFDGVGRLGDTRNNINAENMIHTTRVTIYNNKIMGAHLIIWA